MSEQEMSAVELLTQKYLRTRSSDFAALRRSAEVDLGLLRRGALEHPSAVVRRNCIILLDHLDGDESAPTFVAVLRRDPVPRVRRHALHALTCDRCKEDVLCFDVLPALIDCAQTDENAKLRLGALHALRSFLPDERVEAALAAAGAHNSHPPRGRPKCR